MGFFSLAATTLLLGSARAASIQPRQAPNNSISEPGLGASASKITGYAHFGDSYASGMGAGTTSTDKCRIGSNNYGDQIHTFLNDPDMVWPGPLSCSGDTTVELDKKIDDWKTAKDTTLATLTIGGNDVGFSDLVWYCVVTPNTFRLGSTNRKNCLAAEKRAIDFMDDTSDSGLIAKMAAAYLKILQKSRDARHNDDLDLFVAGYPEFFNPDTTDCQL